MDNIVTRNISNTGDNIVIRALTGTDNVMKVAGYAALYGNTTQRMCEPEIGWFIEKVLPDALHWDSTTHDVVFCVNHDRHSLPLARTGNGSLVIRSDERGLFYEATLVDTQAARDLWTALTANPPLIDKSSYSMKIEKSRVERIAGSKDLLHIVERAELFDCSAVTFPANTETSIVAIRSAYDELLKSESTNRPGTVVDSGLDRNPLVIKHRLRTGIK